LKGIKGSRSQGFKDKIKLYQIGFGQSMFLNKRKSQKDSRGQETEGSDVYNLTILHGDVDITLEYSFTSDHLRVAS